MPSINSDNQRNDVLRGDVYWAQFDPSVGAEIQKIRPVLVLSINAINKARKTFIGVPLSTSAPAITNINVLLTGGSVARCDQVRVLDKSRLKNKIGNLASSDLKAVSDALTQIMGLDL